MTNLNMASAHASKFRLVFPYLPFLGDNEKADALTLYCGKVTFPDLSMEVTEVPSPYYNLKVPSNTLTYGDLIVNYSISENYDNYKLLFEWMMYIKNPERFEVRKDAQVNASLMVYTNQSKPDFSFKLHNIFPSSLMGIDFDKTMSDISDIENQCTFTIDYFEVEELT